MAHQVEKLQRRLEREEIKGRERGLELDEIRAALAARNRELQQSREAADELERRLSEKLAQVATLDRKLAQVEQLLKSCEIALEETGVDANKYKTALRQAKPDSDRQQDAQKSAEERGNRLETQIGALKTALQRSKTMSGEFWQQLNKMRREVHQLGTSVPNGRKPDVGTSTDQTNPDKSETTVNRDSIGRAMQTDPQLKQRVDELRARQRALVDDLKFSKDSGRDEVLREEITDIAAIVVGLSGQRDGDASPLLNMIGDGDTPRPGRKSLAERARSELQR